MEYHKATNALELKKELKEALLNELKDFNKVTNIMEMVDNYMETMYEPTDKSLLWDVLGHLVSDNGCDANISLSRDLNGYVSISLTINGISVNITPCLKEVNGHNELGFSLDYKDIYIDYVNNPN